MFCLWRLPNSNFQKVCTAQSHRINRDSFPTDINIAVILPTDFCNLTIMIISDLPEIIPVSKADSIISDFPVGCQKQRNRQQKQQSGNDNFPKNFFQYTRRQQPCHERKANQPGNPCYRRNGNFSAITVFLLFAAEFLFFHRNQPFSKNPKCSIA